MIPIALSYTDTFFKQVEVLNDNINLTFYLKTKKLKK